MTSKHSVFRHKCNIESYHSVDELKAMMEEEKYPTDFFGPNLDSEYTCSSSTTECSSRTSSLFDEESESSSQCSYDATTPTYRTEVDDMFTPSPPGRKKKPKFTRTKVQTFRNSDVRGCVTPTEEELKKKKKKRAARPIQSARYPVRNVNGRRIGKGLKKVGNMMQASARKLMKLLDKKPRTPKTVKSRRANKIILKAFRQRTKRKTKVVNLPNV